MRKMWRATIWHPDAIPASEGETSLELKRYVLPAFDAALILMAIVAIRVGMPSFDIVFNAHISAISSWTLLVAAVTAAFGLIFPRFWFLEGAGKLLMLFVLGGYASALWALVSQGDEGRGPVAAAFTGLLILPLWTLWRINRERRTRTTREALVAATTAVQKVL